MYIIEESIGLIHRTFTLCEHLEEIVSHKTRSEQLAAGPVRKDPNKLAKRTKAHTPKVKKDDKRLSPAFFARLQDYYNDY